MHWGIRRGATGYCSVWGGLGRGTLGGGGLPTLWSGDSPS